MATETTTKKHKCLNLRFLDTPLRDCDIDDVPGVGPKTLAKLKEANIDTAQKLVGQFLVLDRDTKKMLEWLKDACEVGSREAGMISEALYQKAKLIDHL